MPVRRFCRTSVPCSWRPVLQGRARPASFFSIADVVLDRMSVARVLLSSRTKTACDELLGAVCELASSQTAAGRHSFKKPDDAILNRVGEPSPVQHPARATDIDDIVKERLPIAYPSDSAEVEQPKAWVARVPGLVELAHGLGAEPGDVSPSLVEESARAAHPLQAASRRHKRAQQELCKSIVRRASVIVTTTSMSTGRLAGCQGYDAIIIAEGAATSVPASDATVVRTKSRGRGSGGSSDDDDEHRAERTRCIVIFKDPAQLAPSAGMEN